MPRPTAARPGRPTDGGWNFSSDRGGPLNLWRVEIDRRGGAAREPEPVTTPSPAALRPTLSRDGRRIAYSTIVSEGRVRAYTLDAAATVQGSPEWIVGGPQHWVGAKVSRDGRRLALVRWSNQQDLFVMNAHGTSLRQLTGDPAGTRCPDWSADSRFLAFVPFLRSERSVLIVDVDVGTTRRLAPIGTPAGSRVRCGRRMASGWRSIRARRYRTHAGASRRRLAADAFDAAAGALVVVPDAAGGAASGRPGNQTRVILLTVGLGTFFIMGVRGLQVNLLDQFALQIGENTPDMFLVDIQQDQAADMKAFLAERLPPESQPLLIPVLRARVTGRGVNLDEVEDLQGRGMLSRDTRSPIAASSKRTRR